MNSRMERLWDMVARSCEDGDIIAQAGFKNSFTGLPYTYEEVTDSTLGKIGKYLRGDCTVLEIGVASGITARVIAPHVKKYIGIDISAETLKRTEQAMSMEGYNNIEFVKACANQIDTLQIDSPDIIVMNSVIQYFESTDDFVEVIEKAAEIVGNGVIFVGDVLDLEKKELYLQELEKHGKKPNRYDMWYKKELMKDAGGKIGKKVIISDKAKRNHDSDFNYRYDVIFVSEAKDAE